LSRVFRLDQDQDSGSQDKSKTFFVLKAPRDLDLALEDYITAEQL